MLFMPSRISTVRPDTVRRPYLAGKPTRLSLMLTLYLPGTTCDFMMYAPLTIGVEAALSEGLFGVIRMTPFLIGTPWKDTMPESWAGFFRK